MESIKRTGGIGVLIKEHYPVYWGIQRYPVDRCAAFCKVKGEWGIFSNFAPTPIDFEGLTYSCVEQLFQCMKFTDEEVISDLRGAYGQQIKMKAKHWEKMGLRCEDWGNRFVDVLKMCLRLKYEQSPEFREVLQKSSNLFIVEDQTSFPRKNADAYGCKLIGDSYVGPNLMGRILMELRATL